MGNAQSNGGNHNRLSKPKTNTNSPSGTPKNGSPVSVTSKFADLTVARRKQKSVVSSPLRTEFSCGLGSRADESLEELATQVQVRLSSLSRSNSVTSQNGRDPTGRLSALLGSNVSLITQSQGVDMKTALKIVQEVRKSASPEDLAALHEALQPSSPPPENVLNGRSSVLSRSTSSLIRRRSLISTPGLATRNSPVNALRRSWSSWKTPSSVQEHKWKTEMMGSSPLTRLAALDLAEEGRESPSPRARTPGDMDYSHLGSFRLGSLVVTNGAPSPAASARRISRRRSISDLHEEDDYFAVSDRESSPIMMKPTRQRGHSRSKSSIVPESPPLFRDLNRARQGKKITRSTRPKTPPKPLRPFELDPPPEMLKGRLKVVNKSADTIVTDYMPESPAPYHEARNTEYPVEDLADPLSDAIPTFRADALEMLDGTIFAEPDNVVERTSISSCTPQTSQLDSKSRAGRPIRRPTPSTADSGYSSGGSFRTSYRDAPKWDSVHEQSEEADPAKTLTSETMIEDDDSAVLYDFEQMMALPISQKPLPPLPTADDDAKTQTEMEIGALPPAWEQVVDTQLAMLEAPEKFAAAGFPASPIAPRSITSAMSKLTTESATSIQKRLQKRRPSIPDMPIVQSCQPVNGMIPSVPDNVRAKFVRRLSASPEMECLTRTFLSVEHTNTEELTVDPPSTAASTAISLDFTAPSPAPPSRGRHHRRSYTEGHSRSSTVGLRRSLSVLRGKEPASKKKDAGSIDSAPLQVVDLGDIGSALGRSPYDAAMPTMPRTRVTSPTHPHQLGDALPRAQSMIGMDSKTAAEFARVRSMERAQLRAERPQRPTMGPRPLSYHDANLDVGVAMACGRGLRNRQSLQTFSYGAHDASQRPHSEQYPALADGVGTTSRVQTRIRARSTGRGPMVSQLVGQYDQYSQKVPQPEQQDWQPYAHLWNQRRKSIEGGLREQGIASQRSSARLEQPFSAQYSNPSTVHDPYYGGGVHQGHEGRGYGMGFSGSAGTRQLHSAAGSSRKSMRYSHQFGLDLSDVPVILQRMA